MIKNNVKVKDRLSMDEKINATIYLTSSYFIDGEYTPYYREISDIVVFFKYAVEGLEFEKSTDESGEIVEESIYDCVVNDKELLNLYNRTMCSYDDNSIKKQFEEINTIVNDMVEFEKQRLIHKTTPIEEKVLEILDKESQRLDLQMKFLEEADILQKEQIKQTEYNNKLAELMTPEETVEFSRVMVDKGFDSDEISKKLMEKFFAQKDYKNDTPPIVKVK